MERKISYEKKLVSVTCLENIMSVDNHAGKKTPFIGLLAVKTQFITKKQLKKALLSCRGKENQSIALKKYFLYRGLISPRKMKKLLQAEKKMSLRQAELKFGTIAIKKKYIKQTDLKLILRRQKEVIRDKKKIIPIGVMLVEEGMLTEKQRDHILELQKKLKSTYQDSMTTKASKSAEKQTEKSDAEKLSDSNKKKTTLLQHEIIEGGMQLSVTSDFMTALLTKTDHFNENITLEQVKQSLSDKDIIACIVADEMIKGFIKSSGFKTKPFKIAQGISPVKGRDATMEFFFESEYLKAGSVTEDGVIDFKQRGEIPFVEEGELLVRKTAAKESQNGKNIYGEEITIAPATDIELKTGKGAKLSEDGLKVLAGTQGLPAHTMSGEIAVYQEYTTQGDVGYETGHINYDDNVNVAGRIKAGFKVKGNNIQANEIEGGIVTADQNITIAGGINEGTIYCRGSVRAKFIQKSRIVCLGDVIVEKEIVDSDIESSGKCIVANGKLISSKITAKMGLYAKTIGTGMSEPNIIKVGEDIFTKRELDKNRKKIDRLQEKIEFYFENRVKLKDKNASLEEKITELAHIQDRSQLDVKKLSSELDSMQKDGTDTHILDEHKKRIEQLQSVAQKAEEKLNIYFERSDEIEKVLENQDKAIKAMEKNQDTLMAEKSNLLEWAEKNPGKSIVVAQGSIMSGTIIRGMHSKKRITELIRHAKVMETQLATENGRQQNIYEIEVGSI